MATDEEIVKLVVGKPQARKWPVGTEFNLPDLFGDEWNKAHLGDGGKQFGARFKQPVEEVRVPEVEWVRKMTTNLNIYRRVS
jgi:hypothetical protein